MKNLFRPIVMFPLFVVFTALSFFLDWQFGWHWMIYLYLIVLISFFLAKHYLYDKKVKSS